MGVFIGKPTGINYSNVLGIYTTSGYFQAPVSGIYLVTGIGGGAGGGGKSSGGSGAGGGGAGAAAFNFAIYLFAGQYVPITVGNAGQAGGTAANGTSGSATSFGSYLTLGGGIYGRAGTATNTPGANGGDGGSISVNLPEIYGLQSGISLSVAGCAGGVGQTDAAASNPSVVAIANHLGLIPGGGGGAGGYSSGPSTNLASAGIMISPYAGTGVVNAGAAGAGSGGSAGGGGGGGTLIAFDPWAAVVCSSGATGAGVAAPTPLGYGQGGGGGAGVGGGVAANGTPGFLIVRRG